MNTLERSKRNYQFDGHEVFYVEDGYRCHGLGMSYPPRDEGHPPATPEQIAAFEAEEDRRNTIRDSNDKADNELLSLCGLSQSHFCRFRSVWTDGHTLSVTTRENGVGGISADAIRNPHFESRKNDDDDPTYAYYTFSIPDAAMRKIGGAE